MSEPVRELLWCASALLDQGRSIDRLSRPITAGSLIALLIGPALGPHLPALLFIVGVLAAVAGAAEMYFSVRVGFDAALFRRIANAAGAPDFGGLDTALATLGLQPEGRPGRAAEARIAGARRLLVLQAVSLSVQVAAILGGACLAWSRR